MTKPSDLYATKLAAIESPEALCEIARPLIQAKAKRLVMTAGFGPEDQDDIEQEAVVRLLDRYAAHKSCRLPVLAFINRVLSQSISNQIRSRFAKRRDPRSIHSLDDSETGTSSLADRISERHLDARLGRQPRSVQEYVEMGIDVEESLAELSSEQRELCDALKIDSIAELSRQLRIPRTTLSDKVRDVRLALEERGIREYVQ